VTANFLKLLTDPCLLAVATVDGTSSTNHQFSYTCPSVTPNAAIYFYKFSTPADPTDLLFTTRFTIAGTDGATVTPTQTETGSTGSAVPWGTGALTDPSQGDQPPNLGNGTITTNTATVMPTNSSTGTQTVNADFTSTGTSLASTTATTTVSHSGSGLQALPSLALGAVGAFAAMLFL
jgi:hypothetical protein